MFDKVMRDHTTSFVAASDGPKFMKAMVDCFDSEPVDLLYRLTNPREQGVKRIKAALSCSDDANFVRDLLLPFLSLLGRDELARGTCRLPMQQLLQTMYEVPGMFSCLVRILEADSNGSGVALGDVTPLGWLALNTVMQVPGARSDAVMLQMMTALQSHGGGAASAAAQLKNLLAASQPSAAGDDAAGANGVEAAAMQVDQQSEQPQRMVAVEDLLQCAGGRHDNDHQDFRDIRVMVTSQEALCRRLPFLPRVSDSNLMMLASVPEAALLDRQFRLLREDFVGPLRPCVMVSIQLPPGHRTARMTSKKERLEYWSSYGHGMLPNDALVCLASPGQPLVFATIVRRDAVELAEEQPMIGLGFEPGPETEKVLSMMGCGPLPNTVLVQVSTNFLSTRPVLQCLQGMATVPLAEELVHSQQPQHTTYLDHARLEQDLSELSSKLDPSQYMALRQALTSRVALIQGPPGTGKTYTGVNLCELILKHSNQTIMCVCYTNHALDQFLEALLDKGITDIVRIGSRSKSKRLEEYNLKEKARKARSQSFSTAEARRFGAVHSELESVDAQIKGLADKLAHGARHKGSVDRYLADVKAAAAAKASGSDGGWQSAGGRKAKWKPQDAMRTPSTEVKAAAEALEAVSSPAEAEQLFQSRPELLHAMRQDIWALPYNLRMYLAHTWRRRLKASWSEQLCEELQAASKLQQELHALQESSYEALLRKARVVGCTTTGAALHKSILTNKASAPRVVMVEEAAEILEAHVLTSLSADTQHLIMIGDHKQLRPKVEHYDLSVQAGQGHSLNVSLFERLVVAGFPHATLAVQHRMHPDISALIKHTYPSLQDHSSVLSRPAIKGISSRITFITHAQPELQASQKSSGKIGFLREPERINVLLSRAKHGMVIVGSAKCLRNASSIDARKHWGVVLDLLEASGSMFSGLPAVCQQHGRSLGLLDSPEAFSLHAPGGDAPCSTCVEIRRLLEREKSELIKLESEAARARAESDKKKAKLTADLERMRQQLADLGDQAAAKQANVRLELQKAKLQKELELQKQNIAADLAAWEQQERDAADQELQEMEMDAQELRQQAEVEQKMEQDAAALEKKLANAQSSLQKLDQQADQKLQKIENKRSRLQAKTQDQQSQLQADARKAGSQRLSVVKWKAALARLADQGLPGLVAFKDLLVQEADGGAAEAAGTLDVVFEKNGLGQQLLSFVSTQTK
eukprot:gene4273-4526_t